MNLLEQMCRVGGVDPEIESLAELGHQGNVPGRFAVHQFLANELDRSGIRVAKTIVYRAVRKQMSSETQAAWIKDRLTGLARVADGGVARFSICFPVRQ